MLKSPSEMSPSRRRPEQQCRCEWPWQWQEQSLGAMKKHQLDHSPGHHHTRLVPGLSSSPGNHSRVKSKSGAEDPCKSFGAKGPGLLF